MDKKFREICDRIYEFNDLAGMAAGIYSRGRVCGEVRGYRDYVNRERLTEDHVFHCTSVSKLFTACAVLSLTDRDAFISDILDVPIGDERWKDVRIGHLLTHTSGLPDLSDYRWDEHLQGDDDLMKSMDDLSGLRLFAHPSEGRFRYSNIGYDILGAAVEKMSGMSFEEYVDERIFRPCGMENSSFLTFERDEGELALPHRKMRDRSIGRVDVYPYTRIHAPSSTLTSDIHDMMKFAGGLMAGKVLSRSVMDEVFSPQALIGGAPFDMGLGWLIRDMEGMRFFGHDGMDDGFRTGFWICPGEEAAMVIMVNMSPAPIEKICAMMAHILKDPLYS